MYVAVTLWPYASEEQDKPTLLWVHVAIQGCGRSNERPYKIYKIPMCWLLVLRMGTWNVPPAGG